MKNTLQLLWSFEGASAFDAAPQLTAWAVIATGIHLFPFRTEKLSPLAPMVLGEQSPGRVGRRPFFRGPRKGPFFYVVFLCRPYLEPARLSGSTKLLAPLRVELAQPAYPLADGRVRHEQRREPLLGERIGRVERLGRRARLERHEPRRLLEPDQRVGETVRRVADRGGEP